MKNLRKFLPLVLILFSSFSYAQLKTISLEKLSLPATEVWSNAQFSPTGKEIYLTNSDYNGIWQYSFETKLLKEITRDKHSGYNFSVSEDGSQIAYRRTVVEGDHRTRHQEAVAMNLKNFTETTIDAGNSISTPVFVNAQPTTVEKAKVLLRSSVPAVQQTTVLGIDNAKIILSRNGISQKFDPFGNGKYVWPTLSPDRMKIAAVEMDRGAFVCDISGENIVRLGRCNSPHWTRDGKWIVGMDDRDDGHVVLTSDILAVSPDGRQQHNLTENSNVIAMFPTCSPTENKIVFTTYNGEVYVLTYEEAK